MPADTPCSRERWFHRKNNQWNQIPSCHRKIRVAEDDGAGAADVAADAVVGPVIRRKLRLPTSLAVVHQRKRPPANRKPRSPRPPGGIPPPSAGPLTKCGKSSSRSNRLWNRWKRCRNWLIWRTVRNPPMNGKLNHCGGRCAEFSSLAATGTHRTSPGAIRIPQPPASGGCSHTERCGNQTKACVSFQSAPACARYRRP